MTTKRASPIRILIADHHTLMRAAVRVLLEVQADFVLAGEAADAVKTVELSRRLRPDILLLDPSIPEASGINVLREVCRIPELRVILFTASIEKAQIEEAFRLGVRGIVRRESTTNLLFKAVRVVMSGEYWLENRAISKAAATGKKSLAKIRARGR
jgi:DNA-binding NarL/FixJ family response regulator